MAEKTPENFLVSSFSPSGSGRFFADVTTEDGSKYRYVPREFVYQGARIGDNQYFDPAFLNKDYLNVLKPVAVGDDLLYDSLKKVGYKEPNVGFLIKQDDFLKYDSAPNNVTTYNAVGKFAGPVQGIGEKDGELVYSFAGAGGSNYGYLDSKGTPTEVTVTVTPGKSKFGKLGQVARGIGEFVAGVPLLPEIAGIVTNNPYVYATLKGFQGGASGEDPLKVGLKAGATVAIADALTPSPAGATPVGGTPGVSEVYPVDMSVGGTVTQIPPSTVPGAFEIADAAQLSAQGLSPQYTSTVLQQQYGLTPVEAGNLSLLGEDIAFASADAAQLWKTTGDVAAVQQNLITAGVDPTVSADLANRAALGGSVTDLAMGTADAFGSSPIFTSEGLLSGGSTLDDFAKDIGGNISSTGSTISLNDAFRAARTINNLIGAGGEQPGAPQRQELGQMQPTGVDTLRLPQFSAGVPNIAGLLNPMPYRGPYFDIYTGFPSLLG